MQQNSLKGTYKGLFIIAVFIMLVSRILVLTSNYNWFISPVSLEIIYLFFTVLIVIANNRGRIAIPKGEYLFVLGILLVHTVLWGMVFVDSDMAKVINSQFQSQIMFVIILYVTVWATLQLGAQQQFLKCGYYALALIMCIQLITNFSEVDLTNLANIFSAQDRTRANFGFGHYNALGAACVCLIMMRDFLRKQGRSIGQRVVDFVILVMAVLMLLCSASRSAITGLGLYYILYYSSRLDQWGLSPVAVRVIRVLRVFVVGLLIVWALFGLDANAFLVAAQRAILIEHTLPMFFASGKVLLGLGYASNPAYAFGLTPYVTYWLDSAYIYYLVATGFVGLTILMIAFFVIGKGIYKISRTKTGMVVFAAFAVYAYISLFEATLFNSGALVNYIYLPWFLIEMTKRAETNKSIE